MCPYMLKKLNASGHKVLIKNWEWQKRTRLRKDSLPQREPSLFKGKEQEQELAEKKNADWEVMAL